MKSNKCFYCLNKGEGVAADKGYHYPCTKGIENEGLQDISKCEKYSPCNGFQIGGYYTHMHFEQEEHADCLEWVIHSDGEFPTEDEEQMIQFHICDFEQIEKWVEFWGKRLRENGMIKD